MKIYHYLNSKQRLSVAKLTIVMPVFASVYYENRGVREIDCFHRLKTDENLFVL